MVHSMIGLATIFKLFLSKITENKLRSIGRSYQLIHNLTRRRFKLKRYLIAATIFRLDREAADHYFPVIWVYCLN